MVKNVLSSNSFWVLNKALVSHLKSLETAAFISVLADKYIYHESRNELVEYKSDQYFYATSSYIEQATFISYKRQRGIIKLLEADGIIKTKRMGVPAKLYFTICQKRLLQIVNSVCAQREEPVMPKGKNIYKEHNTNNTKTNNKDNKGFVFKNELKKLGVEEPHLSDWMKVRSNKKASNTETALNRIKTQAEKANLSMDAAVKMCAEKSWSGFEAEWIKTETNYTEKKYGW